MHLFVSCNHVKKLWKSVEAWIYERTNKYICFSTINIILGYLNKDNHYTPLNMIIKVTKKYVFDCAVQNRIPNLINLKNKLRIQYEDQYHINTENNNENHFLNVWSSFCGLFQWLPLHSEKINFTSYKTAYIVEITKLKSFRICNFNSLWNFNSW